MLGVGAVDSPARAHLGRKEVDVRSSHISTDDAAVDGHIVPVVAKVGGYVAKVTVAENDRVKPGSGAGSARHRRARGEACAGECRSRCCAAAAGGPGVPVRPKHRCRRRPASAGALQAQVAAARANAATRSRRSSDECRSSRRSRSSRINSSTRRARHAAAADASCVGCGATGGRSGWNCYWCAGRHASRDRATQALDAARANAALQLSYAQIAAPAGGTVSKKTVEVGQLVQPAQQLMSIVADSGAWVTANFKETQLSKMKVGQPVEIAVDAYCRMRRYWTRAEHQRRDGLEVLAAAAGQRDRKLHQGRAARSGSHRNRQGVRRTRPLRPGMSVAAHVKTG